MLWLMPFGLAVHDIEEVCALPSWIQGHADWIAQLAENHYFIGKLLDRMIKSLPSIPLEALCIVLLASLMTGLAAYFGRKSAFFTGFLMILGMAFLHIGVHIGQAFFVGGYIPGLGGALLVQLPCCLWLYRHLLRTGTITQKEGIFTALLGIALFVPLIFMAHFLGALLIGG